mgnify:CR=1 FL=1
MIKHLNPHSTGPTPEERLAAVREVTAKIIQDIESGKIKPKRPDRNQDVRYSSWFGR